MKPDSILLLVIAGFVPPSVAEEDVAKVRPFRIHVEDATLVDLKERLARTRWPDELD